MPKVIAKKKTPTLKVAGEEPTAKLKRSNATTKKKSRQSLSAVQVAPGSKVSRPDGALRASRQTRGKILCTPRRQEKDARTQQCGDVSARKAIAAGATPAQHATVWRRECPRSTQQCGDVSARKAIAAGATPSRRASMHLPPSERLFANFRQVFQVDDHFMGRLHSTLDDPKSKMLFIIVDLDNVPKFFSEISQQMVERLPFEVFIICSANKKAKHMWKSKGNINFTLAMSTKDAADAVCIHAAAKLDSILVEKGRDDVPFVVVSDDAIFKQLTGLLQDGGSRALSLSSRGVSHGTRLLQDMMALPAGSLAAPLPPPLPRPPSPGDRQRRQAAEHASKKGARAPTEQSRLSRSDAPADVACASPGRTPPLGAQLSPRALGRASAQRDMPRTARHVPRDVNQKTPKSTKSGSRHGSPKSQRRGAKVNRACGSRKSGLPRTLTAATRAVPAHGPVRKKRAALVLKKALGVRTKKFSAKSGSSGTRNG